MTDMLEDARRALRHTKQCGRGWRFCWRRYRAYRSQRPKPIRRRGKFRGFLRLVFWMDFLRIAHGPGRGTWALSVTLFGFEVSSQVRYIREKYDRAHLVVTFWRLSNIGIGGNRLAEHWERRLASWPIRDMREYAA